MTRTDKNSLRRPVRAWIFGLLIGVAAGVASIYLIAHPPLGAPIAGTIAPTQQTDQ